MIMWETLSWFISTLTGKHKLEVVFIIKTLCYIFLDSMPRLSSCLHKYWLPSGCKLLPSSAVIQTKHWHTHRHTNAYKYLKQCLAGNEKGPDNNLTNTASPCSDETWLPNDPNLELKYNYKFAFISSGFFPLSQGYQTVRNRS